MELILPGQICKVNPLCCRLDILFFWVGWVELACCIDQTVFLRTTSDHCLIVLDFNAIKWGPVPFKFEKM